MIIDAVELFLEKYNLLKPKNNIIVAFSGGYDSMCLLDVMKELAAKYDLNLCAVHLNHGWRGEESDKEEENCKNFCSDINFYSEKLSPDIPHTETAAREARYKFFEKCAKKFNSKVILTAHNANDNAETVFYRITRGTGITGLEGINETRGIYYRPLLNIYRADIEKYCTDKNLTPNIDSSNFNTEFARNKIRYEIFPKIRETIPDFEEKLNQLSKNAGIASSIIEKNTKNLEEYSPQEFCALDEFYKSTVIHKFVRNLGLDYDKKKITRIMEFIEQNKASKSGKTLSLTTDLWLFAGNKKFEVVKKSALTLPEIRILKEGRCCWNDKVFSIEKIDEIPDKFPDDSSCTAYIQISDINFTLRGRKDGDIITPLGLGGTQKLKKYLNEKKIPKHEKDKMIFLCKDNEILWAPGIGLSDKIKVVTKPTHVIKLEER